MSRIDYKKLLDEISMSWFYKKPVLFSLANKFEICENNNLVTCFRSGRKKIEFNSSLLDDCTYGKIKGLYELELYRNALNHPNRQRPEFCDDLLWYEASCMAISPTYASKCGFPSYKTIEEYYRLLTEEPEEEKVDQNDDEGQNSQGNQNSGDSKGQNSQGNQSGGNSENNQNEVGQQQQNTFAGNNNQSCKPDEATDENSMEENNGADSSYENEFQKILDDTLACGDFDVNEDDGFNPEDFQFDDDDETSEENSEIENQASESEAEEDNGSPVACWSEDLIYFTQMDDFVTQHQQELEFSPVGTSVFNQIIKLRQKEKLKTSFDIARFFAQKLARGKRKLSRMKPNRRSGFEQMGYMHGTKTKLLVAIDTSDSVGAYFIDIYYSMLKSLSKIINEIYVFQIDTKLQTSKPVKYNPKERQVSVKGRGGTDFNPLFEYLKKHRREFDGLMIFTDGFLYPPEINLYRNYNFKTLWVINYRAENMHWYHKYGEVTYIR